MDKGDQARAAVIVKRNGITAGISACSRSGFWPASGALLGRWACARRRVRIRFGTCNLDANPRPEKRRTLRDDLLAIQCRRRDQRIITLTAQNLDRYNGQTPVIANRQNRVVRTNRA